MPKGGPTSHIYFSQRLRLHYVDWGNRDAPPLLLVHGGRDHCRNWDWVAEELRHDYHIIAPDLRGPGDSQWMIGGSYNQIDYVYDIAQLLRQTDLTPVTIIGHSLGGAISLMYAGLYPENVRKLVAIDGMGPSPAMIRARIEQPAEDRLRTWVDNALFVLFVISGFSGLIYESIWSHYLKLFLGHAAYAQTLVLAIFMGGMAIGSWISSIYSSRWKHLLLTYAIIEGAIGLFAIGFHSAFLELTEFAYDIILPSLATALLAGGMLAFVLSFDEVIVTTFTSGQQSTLPIWISSQLTRPRDRPVTNVVALFVILLTFLPILFAHRLTQEAGSNRQ